MSKQKIWCFVWFGFSPYPNNSPKIEHNKNCELVARLLLELFKRTCHDMLGEQCVYFSTSL